MLNLQPLFSAQVAALAKARRRPKNRGTALMAELGQAHDEIIAKAIRKHGPISRAALACIVGMSRQTVSKRVAILVGQGRAKPINRYKVVTT